MLRKGADLRFQNPFRPGAGHPPPYLAGREQERNEFLRLLGQETVLQNLILTGLRGVGKTVLLDTFKPMAIQSGWHWVGTDLSESTSVDEQKVVLRLLTDLAVLTSNIVVASEDVRAIGFGAATAKKELRLTFEVLASFCEKEPGLPADKLKAVLELVWRVLQPKTDHGVIFAYDEAQNMSDHAARDQYPLSLLLDVFQSIQKKGVPFMLALTGLPTLFPKLVETRTFSERMFRVLFLDKLDHRDSRDAIQKPIDNERCPVRLDEESIGVIIELSGGYPYFIQYICREVFDSFLQKVGKGEPTLVPVAEITRKLDTDFFAGRWARATDRQRELLSVIASLESAAQEFTVQEVVEQSRNGPGKPFSSSHVNQMLAALSNAGLVYKNRHGKYSFAVPMLDAFIRRQRQAD
jgi:Cdc6-like AAA superfamily ATPase